MIVAVREIDAVDVAGGRRQVPWWRASCTSCPSWLPQSRASAPELARSQGRIHDQHAHGAAEQPALLPAEVCR